ncbi:MAG TPA: hypothetical protein VF669_22265 [Tepidisphaeraceae bacterium]|jgi:hypothetical protein
MRQVWIVCGALVFAGAAWAWSQQQNNEPASPRPERRAPEGYRPPGDGFRFRGFWNNSDPPNDEEWKTIVSFWKDNSPRRTEAFTKLPQDRQNNLKLLMTRRYRMLDIMRSNDPQLFELRLKRLKYEDDIFGLTRDLKNSPSDTEPQIRQKLKESIAALVDTSIDERQARIDRWQKLIDEEKQLVTRDKSQRDATIKSHLDRAERESGVLGEQAATTQESSDPSGPRSTAQSTSP